MARRNTRTIQAGHPGRDLANRDVLQITSTTANPASRVEVRRLTGRDPRTGQACWSPPFQVPRRYLAEHATLAYATTQHAALGRTVSTAHVLVDGLGDRQGLYVAMSRGQQANYAYCTTDYPHAADVRRGSGPAPELQRAQRLDHEHAARPAAEPPREDSQLPARDPVSVLAAVLGRDGSELSATETLQRELSRADHLGVLGAIWDDLARQAQATRFGQALRDTLPATVAEQALHDPACTWLWRTLREAEAAGLDGPEILQQAAAERTMDGARYPARVLDSRLRRTLAGVQPQPPGRWAERVPDMSSPELDRYMHELAAAMDDRTRRLGEHAAETQPLWAQQSLGPVPDDPVARADWEQRASLVASYRERYGYTHPAEPIGPAPGKTSPEARAGWQAAMSAIGQVDGIDMRGCTDGDLWLRRGTYERETAWAPAHVADELRLMRVAERDAHVNAVRAEHESRAAKDEQIAARHQQFAGIWQALEAKAAKEAAIFTAVQDTRQQWEAVTETTRRIAIAADIELRRRHPGSQLEPLRPHPSEAAGISYDNKPGTVQEDIWIQDTLDGSPRLAEATEPGKPNGEPATSRQRETDGQLALGLTPETVHTEIPEQVLRIRENAQIAQAKLDELAHTPLPGADEYELSPGEAWPATAGRERDAVLQPPKPDVVPSARVLEHRAAETGAGHAEAEAEPG